MRFGLGFFGARVSIVGASAKLEIALALSITKLWRKFNAVFDGAHAAVALPA
jgi:hypothetical protein